MTDYASIADLQLRITSSELIRLTDEADTGSIDEDKIAAALEAASIEIDSYLASRYPLPLTDDQPLLRPLAVDIAIWNLYGIVDQAGVPEVRQSRYDQAIATLKRIAGGTQTLGTSPQQQGAEAAFFQGPAKLFGRRQTRDL